MHTTMLWSCRGVLDRHDVLALSSGITEFGNRGRGISQQTGAIRGIGPGAGDHAGAVPRPDLGLVGFDQEIERGRIDITLLGQDGFERAHAQFGLGQVRMVVVAVMMVVIVIAHGNRIGGTIQRCRGASRAYRDTCSRRGLWDTLAENTGQGGRHLTDFLTIEKGLGPDGRIAVVRFDRGDGINALSPEALRQLTDAARSFEDDGATSVVVLTGGPKAFSAGFDLKDPEGRSRKTMDIGSLRRHLKLGPRLTHAWQEMEQVTIGAIEGFCIGGGVALAVALDFRVMARDAHMRVPEIGLGMNMSWQSVPRMLHLIGPARTKQAVILADQRISAAEAYEWGLVEEVADPGKAFDAAMALAAKVAGQPPLSVAMTKLTVNRLAHALDDLASHMDVDQFALASMTEDHREGVAAFLERRKPKFRGR